MPCGHSQRNGWNVHLVGQQVPVLHIVWEGDMPLIGRDVVLYEKRERIVTITLNRPERLNSLVPESYDRLSECWASFREDDDARVAILTAAGDRAFCTGLDLKHQAELVAKDPTFDINRLKPDLMEGRYWNPWAAGVHKPIVAAINGYAIAGGVMLLMYCDLRIASSKARIGITEAKVGRGLPWVVPLVWQIPQAVLLQMMLTGEVVDASRLREVGWINEVVPDEALASRAWEIAETIRDNAPLTVTAAKQLWYLTTESLTQTGFGIGKDLFEMVYASDDAVEGPRAFAEKRKPLWKGR